MDDAPAGAGAPDSTSLKILKFGPFDFTPVSNRLSRDGVDIYLTPKAAAVLGYMLERPGDLIRKEEFLAAVWPSVNVREESLTQAISAIRRAIGDVPRNPRFIQTVSGEGYRFIAAVSDGKASATQRQGLLGKLKHGDFWTLWTFLLGVVRWHRG